MHVRIDGYGGDYNKLQSRALVEQLLVKLPDAINMTRISPTRVQSWYPQDKPLDWGYSGFVIIAESHVSIHTWPHYRSAWVDVFSCKAFDAVEAIAMVKRWFAFTEVIADTKARLVEYPHDVEAATPLNARERIEGRAVFCDY